MDDRQRTRTLLNEVQCVVRAGTSQVRSLFAVGDKPNKAKSEVTLMASDQDSPFPDTI